MKIALVAITKHGIEHARALKAALPEAAFFVSEKQQALAPEASTFSTIKDFTGSHWASYDGLVYLVSLGAVVRTIAPFLKSKDEDPAVVVVDDAGRYAIPVLSGHVGGANELSEKIAAALGATAVLTTASDARSTIPVDILGRELGWTLEDKANVTPVSAAVVNERPIALVQECGEKNWWTRPLPLPKNIQVFPSLAEAKNHGVFEGWLIVSDRSTEALRAEMGEELWPRSVIYRPKTLSCGMGCDFGVDLEELQGLLDSTFTEAGLSPKCIRALASIDIKENEEALLALGTSLGVEIDFFSREELNERKTKTMPNPLVMKYTGAIGVCEPSAMLSAGAGDLVVLKHKSKRATLAVARKEFQ